MRTLIKMLPVCSDRVLLPGGGASLIDSGYFSTGKIIYDLALQVGRSCKHRNWPNDSITETNINNGQHQVTMAKIT